MGDLSKNFSRKEFECKCGCGFFTVDPALVKFLQRIRDDIKRPIIILSGCRCYDYNLKAGGVPNSFHIQGLAADIYSPNVSLKILYLCCEEHCPHGLGIYPEKNMIHVDFAPRVQRWIYREGRYWYAFD
jgi:uncharacterized protein YcbK (DUF882 family)